MLTASGTCISPSQLQYFTTNHITPKHAGSTRNKTPGKRGTTTKTPGGHYTHKYPHPQLNISVPNASIQNKRVRNIPVAPWVQRSDVNHIIQIQIQIQKTKYLGFAPKKRLI